MIHDDPYVAALGILCEGACEEQTAYVQLGRFCETNLGPVNFPSNHKLMHTKNTACCSESFCIFLVLSEELAKLHPLYM
jgi:hypothetical protein